MVDDSRSSSTTLCTTLTSVIGGRCRGYVSPRPSNAALQGMRRRIHPEYLNTGVQLGLYCADRRNASAFSGRQASGALSDSFETRNLLCSCTLSAHECSIHCKYCAISSAKAKFCWFEVLRVSLVRMNRLKAEEADWDSETELHAGPTARKVPVVRLAEATQETRTGFCTLACFLLSCLVGKQVLRSWVYQNSDQLITYHLRHGLATLHFFARQNLNSSCLLSRDQKNIVSLRRASWSASLHFRQFTRPDRPVTNFAQDQELSRKYIQLITPRIVLEITRFNHFKQAKLAGECLQVSPCTLTKSCFSALACCNCFLESSVEWR